MSLERTALAAMVDPAAAVLNLRRLATGGALLVWPFIFDTAFTFASSTIRAQFDRPSFERLLEHIGGVRAWTGVPGESR